MIKFYSNKELTWDLPGGLGFKPKRSGVVISVAGKTPIVVTLLFITEADILVTAA